jgi:DNA-binding response OmpR family regulator
MGTANPRTILLVDDQAPVRTVLAALLCQAGYRVLEAASGQDALRLWREHPAKIDVLLSDIAMPGIQGPELAQRLIARQPDLYVLLISGFVTCSPSTFGLDHRRVAFLAKPFRLSELVAKLEDLLARSPRRSSEPPQGDEHLRGRMVLVVDDDETTLNHYAGMLRLEGFHVVTASTAEEGLRVFAKGPVDAVLLDLRMPDIDGLELLRRLRRDGASRTPIAMLTGDYLLNDDVVAQIYALDAALHFKPLWIEDVVAIVQGLLCDSSSSAS